MFKNDNERFIEQKRRKLRFSRGKKRKLMGMTLLVLMNVYL